MHPNEQLINKFYSSFQKRDHVGMNECYHPNAEFTDEAFVGLKGKEVHAMWHMLCERAKDFDMTFSHVQADDRKGSANWEARYTFRLTGRPVHNVIKASFEFQDGKIIRHRDTFDFYKWARMAFGMKGVLLGATPFFKKAVQRKVQITLQEFMQAKKYNG
ncbi:MAG TPA: nuclear transport factor 2 family protein [Acidobacteriota bacterium]|nr:nuclear transport factor 2 family protein [Acidobacteriota bacterium]HNH85179.1 nuclear transport factor 2 family protein [Acidobacteriota bacterium]HNJ41749.1 nuclear transport factor 2 family protein [Acidobacteriota bacterium]